jgi:hypothetical protein
MKLRKDKKLYRQRRKARKKAIRHQHAAMNFRGIPRRLNGSRLGLRRRMLIDFAAGFTTNP